MAVKNIEGAYIWVSLMRFVKWFVFWLVLRSSDLSFGLNMTSDQLIHLKLTLFLFIDFVDITKMC